MCPVTQKGGNASGRAALSPVLLPKHHQPYCGVVCLPAHVQPPIDKACNPSVPPPRCRVSSVRSRRSPWPLRRLLAAGGRSTAAAAGSPERAGGAAAGCGWRAAGAACLPTWALVGTCRGVAEAEAESEGSELGWKPTRRRWPTPGSRAAAAAAPRENTSAWSCLLRPSWSWWWPCWTVATGPGGSAERRWGSWGWFRPGSYAGRSEWAAGSAAWAAGRCSSRRPPESRPRRRPRRCCPPLGRARRWALRREETQAG